MGRLLFFIGFMVLGTYGFYLLVTLGPGQKQHLANHENDTPPDQDSTDLFTLTGTHVTQWTGDKLTWELRAGKMTYDKKRDQALMGKVTFMVYQTGAASPTRQAPKAAMEADGQPAKEPLFTGRSGRARINFRTRVILLEKNVVIIQPPHTRILSQKLRYLQNEGLIRSPGKVTVEVDQTIHKGSRMELSLAENRLTLGKPTIFR